MNYANILVHVTESKHKDDIINSGLHLAAEFSAMLTALHLYVPSYLASAAYSDVPIWGGMNAARQEQKRATERDSRLKADFDKLAEAFESVKTLWRYDGGELAEALSLHARYADLVLMEQHDPMDKTRRDTFDTPAEVAIRSARPVLVFPRDGVRHPIGQRIAVAWNGTCEATRAVTAALPMLKRARDVDVVVVQQPGRHISSLHDEEPGTEMLHYLEYHGVKASLTCLENDSLRVSESLLSAAAEKNADMLCMGVYGHSRLREMALGGVTYELMRHMTVPTLIAG